jgi:hypothetical protein
MHTSKLNRDKGPRVRTRNCPWPFRSLGKASLHLEPCASCTQRGLHMETRLPLSRMLALGPRLENPTRCFLLALRSDSLSHGPKRLKQLRFLSTQVCEARDLSTPFGLSHAAVPWTGDHAHEGSRSPKRSYQNTVSRRRNALPPGHLCNIFEIPRPQFILKFQARRSCSCPGHGWMCSGNLCVRTFSTRDTGQTLLKGIWPVLNIQMSPMRLLPTPCHEFLFLAGKSASYILDQIRPHKQRESVRSVYCVPHGAVLHVANICIASS